MCAPVRCLHAKGEGWGLGAVDRLTMTCSGEVREEGGGEEDNFDI